MVISELKRYLSYLNSAVAMLDFDVKLLIAQKIVKIESFSGNSQVMKQ